jgi:virginiamycin B lyase
MSQPKIKMCSRSRLVVLALLAGVSTQWIDARQASRASAAGVISGTVTADQGEVRAFRVKARDTVHLITYTVFTNKGAYHIYNLPPSSYQVQVMEAGFDSPEQKVELKAGEERVANLPLKARPVPSRDVELVEYDTLYPPARARTILELNAFGFHGPYFHRMPKKSREGWAGAVSRMFHVPSRWPQPSWRNPSAGTSGGYVPPDLITPEEKDLVIDYLAANFGLDSKPRDLELDPLVRDEDALAQAVWVQYDLPAMDPSKPNGDAAKAKGLTLQRGTHDVFPSRDPQRRGTVWVTGSASSSVLRFDTQNLDPKARTTEWVAMETRGAVNASPNSITERNGHVYWTELKGDSIGEIDMATGHMQRHRAPTEAQNMHGIGTDSKGNVWWVGLIGTLGRFDPKSKKLTEWRPGGGVTLYQMRVDQKDRVWAASTTKRKLLMFDPATEKWTTYDTPDNVRRVDIDSTGKVWANEYWRNAVVMVDPDTGKVTEHRLPLKNGNPYETCIDTDDNVWLENEEYQSFVRFEPKTGKFTYFPYPVMGAHTPDMESDAEGTLWSGLSGRDSVRSLTALKPRGNVPKETGQRPQ